MKNHWLQTKEDELRLEIREELKASMEKEYIIKLRELSELFHAQLHAGFDEAFEMVNAQRERAEKAEEEVRVLRLRLLVCTCSKEV